MGRPYGEFSKYYKNGQLKSTGYYFNGKHHKTLTRYYETGTLASTTYFNQYGVLDSANYYFQNGCLEKTSSLTKDSIRHTYYFTDSCNQIKNTSSHPPFYETSNCFQPSKNHVQIIHEVNFDTTNQTEKDIIREVFFQILMNNNHTPLRVEPKLNKSYTKKTVNYLKSIDTLEFNFPTASKLKSINSDDFDPCLVSIKGQPSIYNYSGQKINLELGLVVLNASKNKAAIYIDSYEFRARNYQSIYIIELIDNNWTVIHIKNYYQEQPRKEPKPITTE